MNVELLSHSEIETEQLGRRIAEMLVPGTVITLDGDLGAGKTRFSQAIAKGMGVPGVVNSPTFTIIKEYEGEKLPLYHMDVYRITQNEADDLGLDEYFYGEGVSLVEWSSLIPDILPADRLSIYIEKLGETERKFRIEGIGSPYDAWCQRLKEN